jgi:hypothetical protein
MEKIGEFSHPLAIRIFLPGDPDDAPSLSGSLPIEEMRRTQAELRETVWDESMKMERPKFEYFSIGSSVIFAPLILKSPGMIKVRALCGSDVLRMGSLRIERKSQV